MANKLAYKNREKGDQEERRGINRLKKDGYTVTKSGGSLGCFDCIAFNSKEVRLIQFKYTIDPKKRFDKVIEEIINYPAPWYVYKELWVFYPHVRDPYITTLQYGVTPFVSV